MAGDDAEMVEEDVEEDHSSKRSEMVDSDVDREEEEKADADDVSSEHSSKGEDKDVQKSEEAEESKAESMMTKTDSENERHDDVADDKNELEKFELQIKNEEESKKDIYIAILNGEMNIEIPSQVQLVRIFTSSTFTGSYLSYFHCFFPSC